MEAALNFALIGLGLGALYSLSSQGLMIVYRGSGVLNFAQGAIGMVGAYVSWDISTNAGLPYVAALLIGVLVAGLIGLMTQLLLMRPLRQAAPVVRVVATLGVLILLQGLVILHWGAETIVVPSSLPTTAIHLFGDVSIASDSLILLGVAAVSTAVLWWVYRYSRFGLATAAAAENQRSAAALGLSAEKISAANWFLGSALAGFAAILVSPIVQLQASTMTNLMLAAMAAALLASFRSFPIALFAGLAIGVVQTLMHRYVHVVGLANSFPFLVIIVLMIVRGQSLPLRGSFLQRLPTVGSGRVRISLVLLGIACCGVGIATLDNVWAMAFATTFGFSLVLLSIVVVTGYAGQISLAQFVVAGVGAYIAGRLAATQGVPFELALLAGTLGAVPISIAFALPAVRTRGINLAIVTLGIGTALELMVFDNPDLTGGQIGTVVPAPSLFGLDINPLIHPQRYAWFSLIAFALAGMSVAALRRGRTGRQMIAIRANERAAAALGINVRAVKIHAFAVAGALAGLGGVVLGFRNTSILFQQFSSLESINTMGYAVIGGVGYVVGPFIGSWFAPGSLGIALGNEFYNNVGDYLLLISGGFVIWTVLQSPDGLASDYIRWTSRPVRWFAALAPFIWRPEKELTLPAAQHNRVQARTLAVEDLTVRFGNVVAVEDFCTTVEPGKVTALIGPNGAGKTTIIDAITGFTRPASGRILLDGNDITRDAVSARVRMGISRSFQSLELFEDVSVLDNLRTASDQRDFVSYVRDLVYPLDSPLPGAAVAAIHEFRLGPDLQKRVDGLDYGKRRLLAIARSVALSPSVLLLDEPAAGLRGEESRELARLVRRLADEWGIAILLIEHDMDFVMGISDSVEVLDFGHLIASGTPQSVQKDPAVIAAYLGEPEDEISPAPSAATTGVDG